MSTNYPPHAAGAPSSIRGLLIDVSRLVADTEHSYLLEQDAAGRWTLAEMAIDSHGCLRAGDAIPPLLVGAVVPVEAGARLWSWDVAAGTVTTVTLEGATER